MPQLNSRLSQTTYLFIKKEGIHVRKLLEYLEANYFPETAKAEGWLEGHKRGRKAKILTKALVKVPPKRL
jgi:hypothetical protein